MSDNKRRQFLKLAGLLPAAMVPGCSVRAAPQEHDIQGGAKWERPAKQTGNNLNLIVFVADTFRADNLEAYGSDWDRLDASARTDRAAGKSRQILTRFSGPPHRVAAGSG